MAGLDSRQPRVMPNPDTARLAFHDATLAEQRLRPKKEFRIPFKKFAAEKPVAYLGTVFLPLVLSRALGDASNFNGVLGVDDGNHDLIS